MRNNKQGFTLLELLIVIAIIAILAAMVFVALDPLKRFQDARGARRWSDVDAILSAAKIDQVDNGGTYLASIVTACANTANIYMIHSGVAPVDATAQNANCTTNPTAVADSIDLSGLVTGGYLPIVPISPNGDGTWSGTLTGYTLQCSSTGALTVRACDTENTTEVTITR